MPAFAGGGTRIVDREQAEEWMALTKVANDTLRAGEWTLRLSIARALAPMEVLGLRSVTRRDQGVLRRDAVRETIVEWRQWRSSEEAEKLRSPVERARHPRTLLPTIESRSLVMSEQQRLDCLAELASLVIPVAPACNIVTLDGTTFEFLSRQSGPGVLLSWCNEHPKEWQTLMTWFASTVLNWKDLLRDVPPKGVTPIEDPDRHQPTFARG